MRQDIADDINGECGVFLQHLGVIGSLFAGGIGIQMPTDIFNLPRNCRRIAPRRALEGHVFQEMRYAIVFRRFVSRADRDIGAEGNGVHARHVFRNNGQAIGKAGNADGFGHG